MARRTGQFLWHLPAGVSCLTPEEAEKSEHLRQMLLDYYRQQGCQFISLPLVEIAQPPAGASPSFLFMDPQDGTWLALRDDATGQIAKFAAMQDSWQKPQRYCYAETVMTTRQEMATLDRQHRQFGVEMLHCDRSASAHDQLATDLIATRMLVKTVALAGGTDLLLVVSHGGIVNKVVESLSLTGEQESTLYDLLRRKATTEVENCLRTWGCNARASKPLLELVQGSGNASDFDAITGDMALRQQAPKELAMLANAVVALEQTLTCEVQFDLLDVHRRPYHTGLIFVCYAPSSAYPLGRGGRYDLRALGGQQATGFSVRSDLLLALP